MPGPALAVCVTLLAAVVSGYEPDETECPLVTNPHIFSPEYWTPWGVHKRAWRTLPWKLFTLKQSSIPGAGLGVFANTFIPKYTWLGEYEGEMVSDAVASEDDDYEFEYAWRVYVDGEVTHYADAMREDLSNWLRFINCPRHQVEESVSSTTCYGHIYYITQKDIIPGQELFIYYGDSYAEGRLNIEPQMYRDPKYADLMTGKISETPLNMLKKREYKNITQCRNRRFS